MERAAAALGAGEVTWYAAKDDDALNTALCDGRYSVAVFADLDSLLQSVFQEHAEPLRWKAAGVRIELADPPMGEEAAWRAMLDDVCASHARWRGAQRRMRIICGVILSVLVLAAMAVLFMLTPGGR